MTSTPTTGIVQCGESIREAVESILSSLAVLESEARALVSASRRTGKSLRTGDLTDLRPTIQSLLRRQGERFNGTGVVMAPDTLTDAAFHLEWWQRAEGQGARPLRLNLDPGSETFYDYTLKPWFATPRDQGHGTVMGPYVDLHCAGLYILTFTLPLMVDGAFAGVVGADVPVTSFEQIVAPCLRHLGGEAVVINGEGRILAANSPTRAVGEMARDLLGEGTEVERADVRASEVDWSVIRVQPSAID